MATKKPAKISSSLARSEDATIQITFSIPFGQIKKAQERVATEIGQDIQVPGFRKGKAPIDKVIAQIPQNTLIEKTLAKVLPKLVAEVINEHKIKPAIYPKIELIKTQENSDWQIRAVTCELPKISLGDYKKTIADRAPTPSPKVHSKEEKEQEASKEEDDENN